MVWAMLVAAPVKAQHSIMPTTSKSVLIPLGIHPSGHAVPPIVIDKKHRHQSAIVGFTASGDTLFTGGYKRGHLQGTWMSWYTQHQLCDSGRLERNIPDGEWKSWYSNGQPRSVRTYSAYLLHRIKNEIPRRGGRATFFAVTDIAKTDPSYAWQLLTPGYSYVTLAANAANPHVPAPRALEDRVEQNIESSTLPYLPPFTECIHHGLYMNYYPNGNVKDSGLYNKGLREGVWEEWVSDGGMRSTGAYHKGLKQDTWKYYTTSGRLIGIKTYNRKGKEISSKRIGPRSASGSASMD